MEPWLNLLDETINHFNEGARSVRAYSNDKTYVITRSTPTDFWITIEESGFLKTKTNSLESYFQDVFGIEAHY